MKHLHLVDELQERASMYAAGAMPESERREYAHHLEEDDCEVCRTEVREFEAVANFMAFTLPPQEPSPAIKSRLMAQAKIAALPAIAPVRARGRWFEWTAGIAAVAASLVALVVWNDNVELRRSTESLSVRVAELEAEIDQQGLTLAALTSPEVRVINLAGQGATPMAGGRIFWDQTRRRWLLYVTDLPQVPQDRSYQLWFVPRAGNPVSAGVFNTLADGSASIEIAVPEAIDDVQAAAVTTEPAGGLPQPSGPFALLGTTE